jgi:hypothetical protein
MLSFYRVKGLRDGVGKRPINSDRSYVGAAVKDSTAVERLNRSVRQSSLVGDSGMSTSADLNKAKNALV